MKRITLLIAILISYFAATTAQIYVDDQGNVTDQRVVKQASMYNTPSGFSGFDKRKLEIGGSLGLQFGDYTSVHISPQVGYMFSKYLTAGAGIGYTYWSTNRSDYDISQHYGSFNLYGKFYPIDFLVLSVSPEISRMWQSASYRGVHSSLSKFVPSVVVGGGLHLGPLLLQIKYDVVQDDYSPYGNKFFYSVGYTFNL